MIIEWSKVSLRVRHKTNIFCDNFQYPRCSVLHSFSKVRRNYFTTSNQQSNAPPWVNVSNLRSLQVSHEVSREFESIRRTLIILIKLSHSEGTGKRSPLKKRKRNQIARHLLVSRTIERNRHDVCTLLVILVWKSL